MQPYINVKKGWGGIVAKLLTTVVLLVIVVAPLQASLGPTLQVQPLIANAQTQTTQPTSSPMASTEICTGSASSCIGSVIYLFTVGLMSIFAYIGGYVFSFAIQLTLQSVTYSLDFLTSGWTAVRDIANMAFIFILIYIAVVIIFKAETSGTMTMLAWVVVMALLINFSFFLTRVVVDAGNILAVQFYNAIPAQPFSQTTGGLAGPIANGVSSLLPGSPKDLTAGIMNALQIQNVLGVQSFDLITGQSGVGVFMVNLIAKIFIYIAVGAMLAILAFTFLTVGFKFLIRVIVLWFVIISAPLAFAARAIPTRTAKGLYDQWFGLLINFSFYPAIFLFIFLIITFITQTVASTGLIPTFSQNNLAAGASATSFAEGSPLYTLGTAVAHIVIRMGLIITMLFYGLKLSERVAVEGNSLARGMTGWVGGKVAGSTAWVARQTLARGAYAAANTGFIKNRAARSMFGRPLEAALKGIAGSRLDIRNVPGAKSGAGLFDVNLGTPGKNGFDKIVEAKKKAVIARTKELESSDAMKWEAEKVIRANYGGQAGIFEKRKTLPDELKKAEKDLQESESAFTRNESGRRQIDRKLKADREEQDDDKKLKPEDREKLLQDRRKLVQAQLNLVAIMNQNSANVQNLKRQQEELKAPLENLKKEDLERKKRFLTRIGERNLRNIAMPSIGSQLGAADGWKNLGGKNAHDKFVDAAAEYANEEHKDDEHPPHPSGGGGGGGSGGHPAPTPVAHQDTHAVATKAAPKGGDHGHAHALNEREIGDLAEAVHKNTEALKKMTHGLARRSEQASYNGLTNQSEVSMDAHRLRALTDRSATKAVTAANENFKEELDARLKRMG